MEDFREGCKVCGRLQALRKAWFQGELTMPKSIFWLTGVICLLVGVIWGFRLAPMSHGVTIGCYNGNGSSSGFWRAEPEEQKKEGKERIRSGRTEKSKKLKKA